MRNSRYAKHATESEQEGTIHRPADQMFDFVGSLLCKQVRDPCLHHRKERENDEGINKAHELFGVLIITTQAEVMDDEAQKKFVKVRTDRDGDCRDEVYQRLMKVMPEGQCAEIHFYQQFRQVEPHGKAAEQTGNGSQENAEYQVAFGFYQREQKDDVENLKEGVSCNNISDLLIGGKEPADVEHGAEQNRDQHQEVDAVFHPENTQHNPPCQADEGREHSQQLNFPKQFAGLIRFVTMSGDLAQAVLRRPEGGEHGKERHN